MNKGEKLLYQQNKLAFDLVLAFIALNLFITIFVLRSMTINAMLGIYVMYNILVSLVGFLVAVKVKKYSMGFGVFSVCLGALQFIISFFMPKLPEPALNLTATLLTIASSGILMAGGLVTVFKTKARRAFQAQRKL